MQSLRDATRTASPVLSPLTVSAADPTNLIGIVIPGERVAAVAGKTIDWTQALLQPETTAPAATRSSTAFPFAVSSEMVQVAE
jgi:ATP-dependent Lhr-like helicase